MCQDWIDVIADNNFFEQARKNGSDGDWLKVAALGCLVLGTGVMALVFHWVGTMEVVSDKLPTHVCFLAGST